MLPEGEDQPVGNDWYQAGKFAVGSYHNRSARYQWWNKVRVQCAFKKSSCLTPQLWCLCQALRMNLPL